MSKLKKALWWTVGILVFSLAAGLAGKAEENKPKVPVEAPAPVVDDRPPLDRVADEVFQSKVTQVYVEQPTGMVKIVFKSVGPNWNKTRTEKFISRLREEGVEFPEVHAVGVDGGKQVWRLESR